MKIGNVNIKNRIFLSPMAGVTNEAFRIICHDLGAGLVYAEMVSDKAIIQKNEKTLGMLHVNPEERPLSMQIFGTDAETFVMAAKYVDQNSECDIIDINMGCPAPKIAIKSQAGAALLKSPEKIFEVVKSVVEAVSKPVTVKIRLGWDENSINCVEVAQLCEKAGAKAIALHARTRSQFYAGHADWSWIKKVKESVGIPVIGNGDVFTPQDAERMFCETGCDAIMIARAAQGNPWIFKEINDYLNGTGGQTPFDSEEWKRIVLRHCDLMIKLKGEKTAISEMRKNLAFYLRGKPDSGDYKRRATSVESEQDIIDVVNDYILHYNELMRHKNELSING